MGFEPTTSAVTGRRSNQLSHQAIFISALCPQNQIPKISILYNCPLSEESVRILSQLIHEVNLLFG